MWAEVCPTASATSASDEAIAIKRRSFRLPLNMLDSFPPWKLHLGFRDSTNDGKEDAGRIGSFLNLVTFRQGNEGRTATAM